MWRWEDKLIWKTAHLRLPSVAQKPCMLKLTNVLDSQSYWMKCSHVYFCRIIINIKLIVLCLQLS